MSELDDTALGHDAGPALPAHLRAALLAGDLDGGPSEPARARMANKLAAATGIAATALLGGGAIVGGAAAGGIAGKTIGLVVAAALVGGGIGFAVSELRPRAPTPTAHDDRPARIDDPRAVPDAHIDMPPPADAPLDLDIRALAGIDAGISGRGSAGRARPVIDAGAADAAAPDDLARERQLIDVARSAIRGGDLQLATKSLVEHELRYPRGALVEERRVLAIEVAVKRGDPGKARALADAFLADYPRSVFRARVEELVSGSP